MRHIFLLCSLLFTLMGCNSLAPEERWSQPTPIVPNKHVLLLEYTGQRCVNCPEAAEQVSHLQRGASGAHVVAVAVHGGHLAENGERSVLGLSNVDSEWLTQQAGVTGWPMGSVDGGALSLPPSWTARVAQQLTQPAEAKILLTSRYDATTRQLTTEVAASASLEDCVFTLFLVEDGIPSLQYLSNGRRTLDYVHRHVLRQLLTPRQGIAVAHHTNSQTSWQHTLTLPTAYGLLATSPSLQAKYPQLLVQPERLHLVGFVQHRPTGRVLEVQTIKVLSDTPE